MQDTSAEVNYHQIGVTEDVIHARRAWPLKISNLIYLRLNYKKFRYWLVSLTRPHRRRVRLLQEEDGLCSSTVSILKPKCNTSKYFSRGPRTPIPILG